MTAFIERTLTAITSDGTHHALVIRLDALNAFVDRGGRLLFYDAPITPAKLFTSVEPKPSTRI